jgi:uncharacterized protein
MIIDVHCHAGKGDGLTGPWDTDASLDAYLARADEAGVTHSALLPAFHSDSGVVNHALWGLVRSARQRFWGFCFLSGKNDAGRVHELVSRAVHQYGFVGIKAHRHESAISREICDAARRFGLPVLYDVAGEVAPVELLATEYPDVSFIIPHLGSFADDWRAQLALLDMLERHPNVYTDSAGVRRFDLLQEAVRRASARKLLFGTDGPWLHPGVELAKIRALKLSRSDEDLVLFKNFLRLTARARSRRRPAQALLGTGDSLAR